MVKAKERKSSVSAPFGSSWDALSKDELKDRKEKVRLIKHRSLVKEYWYEEESFGVSLEPKYFWILDFIKKLGFKPEKHMEQIGASVVSHFFGEMSSRKQHLEKRGMEIIGTVNTVVRSIINLLYDLREFDRRLKVYDDTHSDNKIKKNAGDKALKRVWMDEVDMRKGNASINAMASQRGLEFTTLRDAFMMADVLEDIEKMDINRRVKDVLRGRLEEYIYWRDESEKELRQRRIIELAYLKSQVHALKLYSQWARPYLEAAQQLSFEDVNIRDPELVQAFDQNVIKLMIRATSKHYQKSFFAKGGLPRSYSPPETWSDEKKESAKLEKFGPAAIGVIEVEFIYRTKPAVAMQAQTGGAYRNLGKVDIKFRGYSMSEEEYKLLEKQEAFEAMEFIEGMTSETLDTMREDIERYLDETEVDEKKSKKNEKPKALLDNLFGAKSSGGTPALNVFSGFGEGAAVERTKMMLRGKMVDRIFTLYDIFKKAHRLLSFPYFPSFVAPPPPK